MFLCPGLKSYCDGARSAGESVEPALCQRRSVQKCQVVEVREQPCDVLFRALGVGGGGVDCGIEFGYVNRLVMGVAQKVECEVKEAGKRLVFFDVLDVVVLYLEGLGLLV